MSSKHIDLLQQNHTFPCLYSFKFILKKESEEKFLAHLGLVPSKSKESENGKHVSLTFDLYMLDARSVLMIYDKAAEFKGVISL